MATSRKSRRKPLHLRKKHLLKHHLRLTSLLPKVRRPAQQSLPRMSLRNQWSLLRMTAHPSTLQWLPRQLERISPRRPPRKKRKLHPQPARDLLQERQKLRVKNPMNLLLMKGKLQGVQAREMLRPRIRTQRQWLNHHLRKKRQRHPPNQPKRKLHRRRPKKRHPHRQSQPKNKYQRPQMRR